MQTRRVFADYIVLLVVGSPAQDDPKPLIEAMGFGRVEAVGRVEQVAELIRQLRPRLVVAAGGLAPQSGLELLVQARQDEAGAEVPFLIVGQPADLEPGGLAEKVTEAGLASLAAGPLDQDRLAEAIVGLLDPLIDPDQEESYGLITQAARRASRGQKEEAAELYRQAVGLYDSNVSAWLELGSLLSELDRDEEAEMAYVKALEVNSYSLKTYIQLARLYEKRQDTEQAIDVLRQAQAIAKVIEASGRAKSKISFFLGQVELRLTRLAEATESFQQAIQDNPDDAQLRTAIGDAYAEKGYYAQSEPHYQAALEINPDLAHVLNRLAIAYRRQQKYDKALNLYARARVRHPEDDHLLFNMARTHYQAGQPAQAKALLKEALAIRPGFKEARQLLGKLESNTRLVSLDEVE